MKVHFSDILSSSEFDCLNFYDASKLTQQEKINVTQCLRNILSLLLDDIGHEHQYTPAEKTVRQGLQAWCEEHMVHLFPEKRHELQGIIDISASCAEYYYALCQHETKLVMAILTTVLMVSDDDKILRSNVRDGLCYYSSNRWQDLPEPNDWCTVLTRVQSMCAEYFGSDDPLIGSLFTHNFSGFINACAQELRMEHELPLHLGNHGPSHPSSEGCTVESFPSHFRGTSGAPIVYLIPIFKVSRNEEVPLRVWITAIPDLIIFINHVNDLLSLPKELLAGETWNYLSMVTQAKRQAGRPTGYKCKKNELWTFRDTLCETLQQVQSSTLALDQAFTKCIREDVHHCPTSMNDTGGSTQDGKRQVHQDLRLAAQLWTGFKHRFISWHINCNRYSLERMPSERYTYKPKTSFFSTHKHLSTIIVASVIPLVFTIVKFGSK
ncbi:hypothetical protein N7540_001166 [Penicillium herquei]|nr:hypothetical protein N7540_001166 [Penicillium herquei]